MFVVCPVDNLGLGDGTFLTVTQPRQQGQGVGPHQLPDYAQGQGGVALVQVRSWQIFGMKTFSQNKLDSLKVAEIKCWQGWWHGLLVKVMFMVVKVVMKMKELRRMLVGMVLKLNC